MIDDSSILLDNHPPARSHQEIDKNRRFLEIDDAQIADFIRIEEHAQRECLNFIASENYAYEAVREVLGSVFTNIYAEGYPGKRYYPGCAASDEIEILARERAKKLFQAEHANVQPHSGSQANMAVFSALLDHGDTIMGLSLSCGGHLTHGHPVNFSGMSYKSISYAVDPKTEYIDYEALEALAHFHKPKLIITGGSSYSRHIDLKKFQKIARSINAHLLVDIAHTAGLVATGIFPSPFPYADIVTGTTHKTLRGPRGGFILCKKQFKERIDRAVFPGIQGGPSMNTIAAKAVTFHLATKPEFFEYMKTSLYRATNMTRLFEKLGYRIVSGGTDCHLFVIDLTNLGITGRAAEALLEKVGILVSRSAIPFDPQKPFFTSGIRLGTLATAARGLTEEQSLEIVELIDATLKNRADTEQLERIKQRVIDIASELTVTQKVLSQK
jgi:glycine hydroxymethyltransferase